MKAQRLKEGQISESSAAADSLAGDVTVFRPTGKPQEVFAVAGQVRYLSEYAEPDAGLFVWSYIVRFSNLSEQPVQLVGRKWLIRDGEGKPQDVLAASVGGQQPKLRPGDSYTYESGVPLLTPDGDMTGAFGFRTADRRPFIIETRRFELHAPGSTASRRRVRRPRLDDEHDVSVFAAYLRKYQNDIDHELDAELRIADLEGLSSAAHREIIRYLLRYFPFNQKDTPIPFRKLKSGLPSIAARDLFIVRNPVSQLLDIIIKWWPGPDDIEFLDIYDIIGDMPNEPNLTGVRLLAAYEHLQKLDLSDSALTETDRLRLAARLVRTYQRLQKQNLEGVELGSTPQLRLAHRMLKASQRLRPKP
jgi:ApaG protein